MTLYMAVTADEYELPLMVERYPDILCEKLGIGMKTMYEDTSRERNGSVRCTGKQRGFRLRKVYVEEGDEE